MKKAINFRGHTVNLNGLKAEIELIDSNLHKVMNIEQYQRTLSGIIGRTEGLSKESSMDGWVVFGGNFSLREPEQFNIKIDALVAKMQPELTLVTFKTLYPEVREIFNDHVHVIDQRETAEQHLERNNAGREAAQARELFNAEREKLLAMANGIIDLMSEDSALIIQACYDDSDPMTDYFHRDARLSSDYILYRSNRKLVRREALIRSVINSNEELSKLTWEWDKDNCRMESGIVGVSQYSAKKEVHYYYQIRYAVSIARNNEALKSKWFVEFTPQAAEVSTSTSSTGAYVKLNEAKQGVEIYFPVKPSASVLDKIKSRGGWRWAKFNKCWYSRMSESNVAFANEICGTGVALKSELDGAGAMVQANEEAGFDYFAMNNL